MRSTQNFSCHSLHFSQICFWGRKSTVCFWDGFGNAILLAKPFSGGVQMRKRNYKGRCEKRSLSKCRGICKTYDAIQRSYADMLQTDENIKEFQCNVLLEKLDIGEYTSDFVCTLQSNDIIVRECVLRDHLTKPMTFSISLQLK